MDILLAIIIVLAAWYIFKTALAVLLALAAVAIAVWIVRNTRTPRL